MQDEKGAHPWLMIHLSDRRKEMRAIRDAVARQDMKDIAEQLSLMKRLWIENKSRWLIEAAGC
jgi:hypothetical protein